MTADQRARHRSGHLGHQGGRGRPERRRHRRSRGAAAPRLPARTAGSNRTRRRCSTRCCRAGRQALAEAERARSAWSRLANQGETVLAWDRDTGRPLSPAIVWQDRRASRLLRRARRARRHARRADRAGARPVLLGAEDGVAAAQPDHRRGRHDDRLLAGAPALRRVRDRRLDGEPLAADRHRSDRLGPAPARGCSDSPTSRSRGSSTATSSWAPRPRSATRSPVGGLIVDQPAALLAQGCWQPGSAKCTFGTGAFLLANTGARAVRSTAGLTSSVAWRTRAQTAYCVDGQVYTAASAVRWLIDLGFISEPSDLDQFVGEDAGGVLCVSALAGLAAPWWRPDATATFTGHHARDPPRASRRRAAAGHRRASRRADRRDHAGPRPAAELAAGRRRADPLAAADASGRRSHPAPRRAVPLGARDRARRGRARADGARPRPRRSRTPCLTGTREPPTSRAGAPIKPLRSATAGAPTATANLPTPRSG